MQGRVAGAFSQRQARSRSTSFLAPPHRRAAGFVGSAIQRSRLLVQDVLPEGEQGKGHGSASTRCRFSSVAGASRSAGARPWPSRRGSRARSRLRLSDSSHVASSSCSGSLVSVRWRLERAARGIGAAHAMLLKQSSSAVALPHLAPSVEIPPSCRTKRRCHHRANCPRTP